MQGPKKNNLNNVQVTMYNKFTLASELIPQAASCRSLRKISLKPSPKAEWLRQDAPIQPILRKGREPRSIDVKR